MSEMGSVWYCSCMCVLWRCLPMRYILGSISKTPLKSTGNYPGASWRSQKITRRLSLSFWKRWIEKSQPTSRDSFFHGDEQEHPRYFSGHQTQLQILWKASQGCFPSNLYRTSHAVGDPERWRWKQVPRLWYEAGVPGTLDISKAALSYTWNPAPPAVFKHWSCSPHTMMITPLSTGAAWEQKAGGKEGFLLLYY